MQNETTISIDMIFEDAALLYIAGVTPEGEGVLLKKGEDGLWRSDDIAGEYESPSDATVAAAAALGKTKSVTVYQMWHNGNNWEHTEGASWEMDIQPGDSFDDAILRDSAYGDWPDDEERVKLVARDDDSGTDYIAEGVFTAAELRSGSRI